MVQVFHSELAGCIHIVALSDYRRHWSELGPTRWFGAELVVNRKRQDPTESAAALFGYKLRKLRDERGLSQVKLADELHCSGDLISKIETAAQVATMDTAADIDRYFGAGETFQELQPLAAKEGLPGWFRPYADLEQHATSIRIYEHLLVTGLLQTEPYARQVLRAGLRDSALDEMVSSRMSRQMVFQKKDPPWVVLVIREAALREVIGTAEIAKDQLQHVLDMTLLPNINIHIVPAGAQVYPSGGFTIFSFEGEPDVGYVESANGLGRVVELSAQVEGLKVWFDLVRSVAMPVDASEQLIRDIMEGM
jgi:transcriptional regulator with XRE-family HTH domain